MNILTARRLFTFVREGTMYAEFNSVALFTVLYSWFKHCAKDVSTFTAQRTILEFILILSYWGFYVTFNTVQVISQRVVGWAEETSTYSLSGFCTVNC